MQSKVNDRMEEPASSKNIGNSDLLAAILTNAFFIRMSRENRHLDKPETTAKVKEDVLNTFNDFLKSIRNIDF